MTTPAIPVSQVASMCGGVLRAPAGFDPTIRDLLIDSRRLIHPDQCLFIALISERNDGHQYIHELYERGVTAFMVSAPHVDDLYLQVPNAAFITVDDTLDALQQLSAAHRMLWNIPVIGITGSNGKTIVKEWLFQMLGDQIRIIRSPKSYNSQVGVPLSVWNMDPDHQLAIFEAGISRPGEMERLERIIRPDIGVLTNIGHAHDEHFDSLRQKTAEKLKLFAHARWLVCCADHPLITESLHESAQYRHLQLFTWGRGKEADLRILQTERTSSFTVITAQFREKEFTFRIPFTDAAATENALHALAVILLAGENAFGGIQIPAHQSGQAFTALLNRFENLVPIAMRLELKEAINRCSLINDSYNSDINSLHIALDFLNQQNQQKKKTVIMSDILQSGREKQELYREIAGLLSSRQIGRIIGIGRDMRRYGNLFPMEGSFFATTDEFLQQFPMSSFQNETILLKGARMFEFEKISQVLQQKAHETVMEINLDAMVHNLNHFRSGLPAGTRLMAMVKAFSYGSGSYEIANVLQYYRVDYLAVAYADEGVELRKAGIHLPVMVMSPEEQSLDVLLKYNLEPEIYNFHILGLLEKALQRNVTSIQQEVRIHLKLDTGMHRLGFGEEEAEPLIHRLKANPQLRVQSVFSHLASSEDPGDDDFTRLQIRRFSAMSDTIIRALNYPVLRHILNTAGIRRFPEARFDMVRLGIGLYGVGSDLQEQARLRNVSTLKTVITQIRFIPAGESIGYNRKGRAATAKVIAVVPVGYADGLNRRLGSGTGRLWIKGRPAPVIGNICMDLTMIDLTEWLQSYGINPEAMKSKRELPELPVREGDEAVIFNDHHPVSELARALDTIPYEVLTGISRRVKRIYFYE